MKQLIYVVDDEPDILELVSLNLKKQNYNVEEFETGEEILREIKKQKPDLIILDLMLPDTDGLEICKTLKGSDRYKYIPVIMLTAKGEETDKIIGLELGADDYITKPFSVKELAARVKAILRRSLRRTLKNETKTINDILVINPNKYEVKVKNKAIDLTTTEFKILSRLAQQPGWVVSRDSLLEYLWKNEKIVTDRTIDVH
ncbi:MAG TPA: response regulator, partial [Spirochaetota bacterium]|nr:response regulator [Spirochaetota bacterium]